MAAMVNRLRRRIYTILEGWDSSDPVARIVDACLLTLIGLNVVVIALETMPGIVSEETPDEEAFFIWFEVFSVAVFSVEYVARLWVAVEAPEMAGLRHWRARLKAGLKPMLIVDLVAVLPSYLFFLGLAPFDLRILRIVRLLRILKLTRYSPALQTIASVIYKERTSLLSALVVVVIMLVLSSSLIYFAEHEAQPEKFSSIPASMWWAMETLTTVGYGDMTPVTTVGKIIGGIVMLTGIGLFVLWTGIFASSFVEELRTREFKVTWNMVTRVPEFADLPAEDVAEIAAMMRPLVVPARYTIVRTGETATAMFFVVDGEVEVELLPDPIVLGPGEFFGEVALLHDTVRRTSVIALTECRLMMLDADDFRTLLQKHDSVRHAIEAIATERKNALDNAAGR